MYKHFDYLSQTAHLLPDLPALKEKVLTTDGDFRPLANQREAAKMDAFLIRLFSDPMVCYSSLEGRGSLAGCGMNIKFTPKKLDDFTTLFTSTEHVLLFSEIGIIKGYNLLHVNVDMPRSTEGVGRVIVNAFKPLLRNEKLLTLLA